MSNRFDIIIIGAGVAGMTAAIYAKRANKKILLLESKIHGGQIINSFGVANWPGEINISGADLSKKFLAQLKDLGVEVEYDEVTKIHQKTENDKPLWVVETEDDEYICEALIIATGTKPRELSKKQMKDVGERPVSYCATCDGAIYKGKKVVVVGSGNTAKHETAYLENIASHVYHIHHDEPIPEDAEAIFVAIGRVPSTEVVKDLVDTDDDGYIKAGEDCKTSVPGVFVAGDCRTKALRQLVTASSDGAVAASMAVKYLNESEA